MELKELLKRLTDCKIAVKVEMDHSMILVRTRMTPSTIMDRPAVHSYYEADLDNILKAYVSYEEWFYQVLLDTVCEMKNYCQKYHYRYEVKMLKEILENETN